jgi:membrane protein
LPSVKERLTGWLERVRKRRPFIDHLARMQQHYGGVQAAQQAGAVTYYAFLSIFPILAIAFFVVGRVAEFYPSAQADLITAVNSLFGSSDPDKPGGLIGDGANQISVETVQNAASTAGIFGAIGLLYAGLGWLSAMRGALGVVFEQERQEHPNFVVGKLFDLVSLVVIGAVLLLSVALAGFVTGFTDVVLGWVHLEDDSEWLVELIGRLIAFVANVVLFYALFKILARPHVPDRSLWSGALLGAVAFEALKAASFLLLASTKSSPAVQAFGIALILLVWINYTSRGTLYAASWANTTAEARAIREQEALDRARMDELTRVDLHEAAEPGRSAVRGRAVRSFAAGSATTLALVAALRRNKKEEDS